MNPIQNCLCNKIGIKKKVLKDNLFSRKKGDNFDITKQISIHLINNLIHFYILQSYKHVKV